jgi:hypothetical protein
VVGAPLALPEASQTSLAGVGARCRSSRPGGRSATPGPQQGRPRKPQRWFMDQRESAASDSAIQHAYAATWPATPTSIEQHSSHAKSTQGHLPDGSVSLRPEQCRLVLQTRHGSSTSYTGQLGLVTPGKWLFHANVTSFGLTGTAQGLLGGTGSLYWWNSSLTGAGEAGNSPPRTWPTRPRPRRYQDPPALFGITITTPVCPPAHHPA